MFDVVRPRRRNREHRHTQDEQKNRAHAGMVAARLPATVRFRALAEPAPPAARSLPRASGSTTLDGSAPTPPESGPLPDPPPAAAGRPARVFDPAADPAVSPPARWQSRREAAAPARPRFPKCPRAAQVPGATLRRRSAGIADLR